MTVTRAPSESVTRLNPTLYARDAERLELCQHGQQAVAESVDALFQGLLGTLAQNGVVQRHFGRALESGVGVRATLQNRSITLVQFGTGARLTLQEEHLSPESLDLQAQILAATNREYERYRTHCDRQDVPLTTAVSTQTVQRVALTPQAPPAELQRLQEQVDAQEAQLRAQARHIAQLQHSLGQAHTDQRELHHQTEVRELRRELEHQGALHEVTHAAQQERMRFELARRDLEAENRHLRSELGHAQGAHEQRTAALQEELQHARELAALQAQRGGELHEELEALREAQTQLQGRVAALDEQTHAAREQANIATALALFTLMQHAAQAQAQPAPGHRARVVEVDEHDAPIPEPPRLPAPQHFRLYRGLGDFPLPRHPPQVPNPFYLRQFYAGQFYAGQFVMPHYRFQLARFPGTQIPPTARAAHHPAAPHQGQQAARPAVQAPSQWPAWLGTAAKVVGGGAAIATAIYLGSHLARGQLPPEITPERLKSATRLFVRMSGGAHQE